MSPTEENYLKNLFYLENKLGEATVNELSKSLDIKMSTVNSMMKKFAEKGLVHYESYKPLKLTEKGRQEAALILRKHRLTEMFLYEKMGLGWEEVHSIAEQIEHINSVVFFDRMDELLNHPHIDPHGSPIPDKKGNIPQIDYHRLSDCKIGEVVTFSAVIDSSEDFLNYLSKRSLILGTQLNINSVENFDGSMTISYQDTKADVLSKFVCDRLLVVKV
ncbi:DtxR family Mn-dependent transcriptional regulator [Dysgonomonas alginatilytica]|uniref:Transcriptional regulator MntR n=1 Tax=Dysgonomonas alginatilytica TaxID=1605892 RepID=A0A2V3PQC1_9BACT|nr:metal-dependent transcriptional regulator [Dysgonomonas alginatilytica]PXV65872.1 DtxR family Mn-dependent transcriptional regulator [Dysgonomonas alginatilytica]